jgi:hypothetical protein
MAETWKGELWMGGCAGFIPIGLSLLAAKLDHCKTTFLAHLASICIGDGKFPDGSAMESKGHILIYRTAEEPRAKWDARLLALGCDLARRHYVDTWADALAELRKGGYTAFLVEPLQQVLGGAFWNHIAVRTKLNELTEVALEFRVAAVVSTHCYPNGRIYGPNELLTVPRCLMRIEKAGGRYRWLLMCERGRYQDHRLAFRSHKDRPNDDMEQPRIVFEEGGRWVRCGDSSDADIEEVDQLIFEATGGMQFPVLVTDMAAAVGKDHGWMSDRKHVRPASSFSAGSP